MPKLDITKETGFTAETIAQHLLHQIKLDDVPSQYRRKLEAWLERENGGNQYNKGSSITVPDGRDTIRITLVNLHSHVQVSQDQKGDERPSGDEHPTEVPSPLPEGWKLTKDGCLERGSKGFLIDEHGLYILSDGRRLDAQTLSNNAADRLLRIGDEKVCKGLAAILNQPRDKIEKEFCAGNHETLELFRSFGDSLHDVVYQAFQINICYTKDKNIVTRINETCLFFSIGEDETGIPIVATRVGFYPEDEQQDNKKRLIIAGPHGDERSAQRLIMVITRYFIKHGPLDNTVLYFIPSISPTLTFADARGIPFVDEENTPNDFWERNNGRLTKRGGKFILTGNLTIPALHNTVDKDMRGNIQRQKTPHTPEFGIDSNRDVTLSLKSSQAFMEFIRVQRNAIRYKAYTETRVTMYVPNLPAEDRPPAEIINNLRVLMIHGYDNEPTVYGPYFVWNRGTDKRWPARMSIAEKIYVNDIRVAAGWERWSHQNIELRRERGHLDQHGRVILDGYKFFYGNTAQDAREFEGEWSWQLRDEKIWAADIELPRGQYNEGVRGEGGDPPYNVGKIDLHRIKEIDGEGMLGTFASQFYKLLNDFPWEIKV